MKKVQANSFLKKYQVVIILTLFLVLFTFMSLGYAALRTNLFATGFITVNRPVTNGSIKVNSVTYVSNRNVSSRPTPQIYNNVSVNFGNVRYNRAGNLVYRVEIKNDSDSDFIYNGYEEVINARGQNGSSTVRYNMTVTNITNGDIIASGKSVNATITLTASAQVQSSNALVTFKFGEISEGRVMGVLQTNNVDLSNGGRIPVSFAVVNTFDADREFYLISSSSSFQFVDENGDEIESLTAHNGSNNFRVYIKCKDGTHFMSNVSSTQLIMYVNGVGESNIGIITAQVPYDQGYVDEEPPKISGVTITQAKNNGSVTVNWIADDTGGTAIDKNYIYIYKDDNNANTQDTAVMGPIELSGHLRTYTTKTSDGVLPTGDYYAIVYAKDEVNSGASYVSSATYDEGYASRSETVSMKWMYSVTIEGNYTFTGGSEALKGSNYSGSFTGTQPNNITITMDGVELTTSTSNSSYYSYDTSSGAIIIYNIQGDVVITPSSCLVEGTLITLADGSKKRIEDIKYDDLLLIWNFELGEFSYNYPVWIEKTASATSYQLTTFSDGSTLKTIGYHGIFSYDKQEFVDMANREDFHIGTRVAKVEENDGSYSFKEVTVSNIEIIEETVKYYQVISTVYYDVISDDYMTVNANDLRWINVYDFNSDITFKTNRRSVVSDPDNLFPYEIIKEAVPLYMYYGMHSAELKYLIKIGRFSIEDLMTFNRNVGFMNNNIIVDVPKNEEGINLWMVTTSDDEVINKEDFLKEEGSIFILPEPKNSENFVGWMNTVNTKMYQPGEEVTIHHGTHFVAIYE